MRLIFYVFIFSQLFNLFDVLADKIKKQPGKQEIKWERVENKKSNNEEKTFTDQPQNTNTTFNNKNSDQKKANKLPLPSRSIMTSSEFNVLPRGYVKLNGPEVSLNLEESDAFEALKLVGKLGNYGIVIIEENNSKTSTTEKPKITAIFENADISDVFNSI